MNSAFFLEERQRLTDEQFWSEETKDFPTQAEWETLYKKNDQYEYNETIRDFVLNGDNLSPSTVKLLLQARDKGLDDEQEYNILLEAQFGMDDECNVYKPQDKLSFSCWDTTYPTIEWQQVFDDWVATELQQFIDTGTCEGIRANYTGTL